MAPALVQDSRYLLGREVQGELISSQGFLAPPVPFLDEGSAHCSSIAVPPVKVIPAACAHLHEEFAAEVGEPQVEDLWRKGRAHTGGETIRLRVEAVYAYDKSYLSPYPVVWVHSVSRKYGVQELDRMEVIGLDAKDNARLRLGLCMDG